MPTSSGQPLSGLKVLDFTWHLAGPYGSKLLADYGADVVKVERPGGGDPARRYGPFPGDQPHPERSGLFLHVNTNKRSITLNLADDSAKAIAFELARVSDIVIESFSPGVMDAFGLGYEALRAVNPRLVMCSLSSYGQTGPYRDWKATDMTMYALAGSLKTMGVPSREPLRNVDHLTEYQAGNMAAMAVMGAVVQQHWADEGQYIDVSVYEVAAGSADRRLTYALGWQYTGDVSERMETQHMALPAGNFPCADGYLNFMISPPRRWPKLFHMLGHPEYIEDERMKDASFWETPEAQELVDGLLYPWLMERTRAEVVEAGQAQHLPVAGMNTPSEILNDPHYTARGFFVEADHAEAGRIPHPGPTMFLNGGGWEMRRAAPLLGEHNREVLCGRLGLSLGELSILRGQGAI